MQSWRISSCNFSSHNYSITTHPIQRRNLSVLTCPLNQKVTQLFQLNERLAIAVSVLPVTWNCLKQNASFMPTGITLQRSSVILSTLSKTPHSSLMLDAFIFKITALDFNWSIKFTTFSPSSQSRLVCIPSSSHVINFVFSNFIWVHTSLS